MGEMTKSETQAGEASGRSPRLPDRRGNELFVADVFDGLPKGDMASMEFPVFSLSTKPDREIRRFDFPDGHFVEITPSAKGLATVYDRDILIYVMSQLVAAKNADKPIAKTIRFVAHDLLRFSNRVSSGEGYTGLKQALERLRGTTISTNVKTGGEETFEVFGLIDKAKVVSETRDGRMKEVEVTLSDWSFRTIESFQVLTYNPEYFRLRKPLERRLYDIARKMCGEKKTFRIGLEKLKDRCGSRSTPREFKRLVKAIADDDAAHAHIPDYGIRLGDDEIVEFTRRKTEVESLPPASPSPVPAPVAAPVLQFDVSSIKLKPGTYDEVREAAPGWDKYYLEQMWRSWMDQGVSEPPRNPDAAFLGFCRKHFARNGAPK